MSADRVELANPNTGRADGSIAAEKYREMKRAILKVVPRAAGGMPFAQLRDAVRPHLSDRVFAGASVSWYATAVKLDLEARGVIERVPGVRPQHIRRTTKRVRDPK